MIRALTFFAMILIAASLSAEPPAKKPRSEKVAADAAKWAFKDLGAKTWTRDKTGPENGTYHALLVTVGEKDKERAQRVALFDANWQLVGDVEYPTARLTDPKPEPVAASPLTGLMNDMARGKYAPQKFKPVRPTP